MHRPDKNFVMSTAGLYLLNFNKGGRLSARPEGPTLEARRADSGGGVLERAPSPPARGSGERCKLPQRGPGRKILNLVHIGT